MQEGHDVDPDERTARVKGNECPLPLSPTPIATPLCTSRMLLTILVAKATKMEISPPSKAKRSDIALHAMRVLIFVIWSPFPGAGKRSGNG